MPTLPTTFRLDGRRALITASSRGIGRAIAQALAEAGAAVVVHAATRIADAEAVAAGIRAAGGRAHAVAADFSDPDAAARLAEAAERLLGGIDILVSNASIQIREKWDAMTSEAIDRQLQVNLKSALVLIRRLAPDMAARGWGRIVTVGSVQEAKPHPEMLVYAAAKAAQTSVVRNLARQLGGRGVTVNNLAPGVITTERNTAALADPAYAEAVRERIPVGDFGAPEDCAGAALLLCSQAGRYITGASIPVDGGMSL